MTKYFCDQCGKEVIAPTTNNRISRRYKNVMVEVIVGVNSTWNAGTVCENCVKEAVQLGNNFTNRRLVDE